MRTTASLQPSGTTPSLVINARKPRDSSRYRLPFAPNTCIGREREVEQISAQLLRSDIRLLTLTGSGGVGKTRQALEVASSINQEFAGEVVFVSLAAVTEPDQVLPEIGMALGLRDSGNQTLTERIATDLSGQSLLLVLDIQTNRQRGATALLPH